MIYKNKQTEKNWVHFCRSEVPFFSKNKNNNRHDSGGVKPIQTESAQATNTLLAGTHTQHSVAHAGGVTLCV